jgi:hypothetical protein
MTLKGRKESSLNVCILRYYLCTCPEKIGKSRKPSFWIAGLCSQVRNWNLPSTKHDCQPLDRGFK